MKVRIKDETIRKNILLFKELLRLHLMESGPELDQDIYEAFIHRKTGEIQFPEISSDESLFSEKEWKPILVQIHPLYPQEEGVFEVVEAHGSAELFHVNDLLPAAYKIVAETMKTLNRLSTFLPQQEGVEGLIQEFIELDIESPTPTTEKRDLVHEAWHQTDRLGAEAILKDAPVGTFLFRKDQYAALLEKKLIEEHKHRIKCITVTYKEGEGKISEKTLVTSDHKWQVYNDDPSLSNAPFVSIYSLMDTMKEQLKMPLLND